jgi:hypothetical protein
MHKMMNLLVKGIELQILDYSRKSENSAEQMTQSYLDFS